MCRPFYIGQKIGHQFLHAHKPVSAFHLAQVLVVTFSALIVIAHDAQSVATIKKAVFQTVRSFRRWFWQLPDGHLNNRVIRQNRFVIENPLCLHMVTLTIINCGVKYHKISIWFDRLVLKLPRWVLVIPIFSRERMRP